MAALLIDGECYGSSSVDHWKVLKELERLISVPQFTVRCFYVEYDLNKQLCNQLLKAPPFGPKYEIENVTHECIFSKMIECCEGTNCRTILVVSNNTTVLHGAWFVESKGIKVYIISNAGETDPEFLPYRIADQENKTITIDDIIARYRVVPVNATKRKFGDSDAPPLEDKRLKLSEVSQLPNIPEYSTNLLSEVIALKKERKFEFQQSLGGDPKIHNLVYRVKLIVSNALIGAANGEYTYYGVMNKGGYFQKSGEFLPAKSPGKFMIYRCRVSFNNFKWFLSFVLSGTRAGGTSDHNFYFSDGQNKGCALPVDKWYCMTNNYKNDRDMTVTAEWPNELSSSLNQSPPAPVLQVLSSQRHPPPPPLFSSRPQVQLHSQQPQPSVAFSTRKTDNQQQAIIQPYRVQQSTAPALTEPRPPRSQRIIQPYDVPYTTNGENSTRAAQESTEQSQRSERDEEEDVEDRNMRVNRHILRVRAGQEDRNKYEENTLDSLLYLRRTTLSVVNSSIANVNGVYEYAGIMNGAGIYEKAVGKDLYVVYRCRMNSKEFPCLWFLSLLISGTERDIQPGGKEGQHFYFSVGDDEDIPVPYKPWSSLQITFRTDASITVSVNTIPIASTDVSATMTTAAVGESLAPLPSVQPLTSQSNPLQTATTTYLETAPETARLEVAPALRIAPCLTLPVTSISNTAASTSVAGITTGNIALSSSGGNIAAGGGNITSGGNSSAGGNVMHVIEDVLPIISNERQLAADRIKATVDAMRVRNAIAANVTAATVHPVTAPTAAEPNSQITQPTISLSTLSAVNSGAGAAATCAGTSNSSGGPAGSIIAQLGTAAAGEDWDAVKADIQQCSSFSPISADEEDGFRTAASAETERIAMIAKLKQARKITLGNEFDLPQWSHLSYLRQSSLLVKNCCKKNSKANGEFKFWRLMNSAACYEMQTNNGRYVIYRCKLERNKQTWFAWFLSYIRDVDSSGQRRTDLQFPGPKDYQCYFAPCCGSPVPDQPWQNMDANDSSNITVIVRNAVKPATSFAQSSAFQFAPPTPRIYNYQNSGTASNNHYSSSGHQTPSFSQLGGATPIISSTPVHHLNWALGEDWRLSGTGNPASGAYVGQNLPAESPRIRFADNILDNSTHNRSVSMQSPYIRPTTDYLDTDRSLTMQSPHHCSLSSSATPRHYLSEDSYDKSNRLLGSKSPRHSNISSEPINYSSSTPRHYLSEENQGGIRVLGSKSPRHSSSISSEPVSYSSSTPRHYLSEDTHGGSSRVLGSKSPRHSNYEYDRDRNTTQPERNNIRSRSSGRVVVDRPSSAPRSRSISADRSSRNIIRSSSSGRNAVYRPSSAPHRSDSADRNSGASWRRNQEKIISFLHSTRESTDFDTDFEWKPPRKFSFLEDRSLVVKKSEKSDGTYHFAGMLNGAAMFTLPLKEGSYCIYKCDFLQSTAEKGPKHIWFLSYVRENCRPGGRKDENYYYCEDKESGRLLPEGGEWWSMMRSTFMKDRRLAVTVERSLGPIAAIELIPNSVPNSVPNSSPNSKPATSDPVPTVANESAVSDLREITSKHDARPGTNQSDERNNSSSTAKDAPPSTQPASIQSTESSQLSQVVHLDGGPRPSTSVHPISAFLSSSTTTKPIVPVTATSAVKTISAVSIAASMSVVQETTAQTPLTLLTTMFPRISTVQAECALQQCADSICSELSADQGLTMKATSLCLAYFQKLYQRQRAKSHFSFIKSSAVDLSQSLEEYDVQSIRILTSLFPSLSADQVETDLFNVTLEVEALGEAFKDELAILPVFYHCQLLNELQKMSESKVRA